MITYRLDYCFYVALNFIVWSIYKRCDVGTTEYRSFFLDGSEFLNNCKKGKILLYLAGLQKMFRTFFSCLYMINFSILCFNFSFGSYLIYYGIDIFYLYKIMDLFYNLMMYFCFLSSNQLVKILL